MVILAIDEVGNSSPDKSTSKVGIRTNRDERWLSNLIFRCKDDKKDCNLFSKVHLERIGVIERKILAHKDYKNFCHAKS